MRRIPTASLGWFAVLLLLPAAGCDDSSSASDGGDTASDTAADVPTDAPVDVAPDAEADDADGADGADVDPGPWDVTVTIEVDGRTIPVNLAGLGRTTFEGSEAVRLTRVVEMAVLALPWDYHYDFIGNDGFDPLVERLDGDLGRLPCYGELELGFLYWDVDDLRVGWDASLGFPGSLGVRAMADGIIRATPIAATTTVVAVGEGRTLVDLTSLPTVDVVDYLDVEDGAQPSIPFPDLLAAAGATTPEAFAYKMWGNDGWSNGDANLMPWANAQHAWIRVDTRRIVIEEGWNTDECCWRCRDTILIKGLTP